MTAVANDNFTASDVEELERSINSLVRITHKMAAHWWIDPKTGEDLRKNPLMVPVKLALVHGEVSEALEADRTDAMDDKLPQFPGIWVELVDVLFRVGDLAGAMKYDLGPVAVAKAMVNATRADHKLENRAKAGGKKY
ncbi:hypothetical protein [Bradyrhizobium ottawaense]|uniref:Pyrophosphatase n=1 Tax=Bradyrhizobium ottawaense TaxID=931866 RepID=A0ABY0QHH6_9BRAD|nr:hypothetical protein [Bradyrhizobium ottawaense]SDH37765.1 hypothetical protein SAMN05444163_0010 [Bradyrhizobium ottawaense]SDK46125.1 hypothetical protein SAMN05444163_8169 [Bradyrhizobium ottawaense]